MFLLIGQWTTCWSHPLLHFASVAQILAPFFRFLPLSCLCHWFATDQVQTTEHFSTQCLCWKARMPWETHKSLKFFLTLSRNLQCCISRVMTLAITSSNLVFNSSEGLPLCGTVITLQSRGLLSNGRQALTNSCLWSCRFVHGNCAVHHQLVVWFRHLLLHPGFAIAPLTVWFVLLKAWVWKCHSHHEFLRGAHHNLLQNVGVCVRVWGSCCNLLAGTMPSAPPGNKAMSAKWFDILALQKQLSLTTLLF